MDCNRCGEEMEITETDSRQEWTEETYTCPNGHVQVKRTEYDQHGTVTSDEIHNEKFNWKEKLNHIHSKLKKS